jgi:hypothetical protein
VIAYIICEGDSDVELLHGILPKEILKDVEIVAAGGLSAIKSLSRSLLVRRQAPLAIVADADSTVPDLVQERLNSIEEIVKSVAINTPVKVILAVPSIEVIFFEDHSLLPRLLGYNLSQEMLSLATSQPKDVLQQLLSQSQAGDASISLQKRLTSENLEILRKSSVIKELIQFLQFVKEPAKAL